MTKTASQDIKKEECFLHGAGSAGEGAGPGCDFVGGGFEYSQFSFLGDNDDTFGSPRPLLFFSCKTSEFYHITKY